MNSLKNKQQVNKLAAVPFPVKVSTLAGSVLSEKVNAALEVNLSLCGQLLKVPYVGLSFLRQQKSFARNPEERCRAVRLQGIVNFCHCRVYNNKGKTGKRFTAQVLPDLQRRDKVRQRSISADSVFGYFCRDKSD